MLRRVFPFILAIAFVWYLPEIYLGMRNLSAALFQEAQFKSAYRVEIKVAKALPYFPEKYGILGSGERNLRIELANFEDDFVRSALVNDIGTAVIESVPAGKYQIRVASPSNYSDAEVAYLESNAESTLQDADLIPINPSFVEVTKDLFIAPVIIQK